MNSIDDLLIKIRNSVSTGMINESTYSNLKTSIDNINIIDKAKYDLIVKSLSYYGFTLYDEYKFFKYSNGKFRKDNIPSQTINSKRNYTFLNPNFKEGIYSNDDGVICPSFKNLYTF